MGLGHLGAHVLVPELAELADGKVLAVAEIGVAGVLPQDVRGQMVGLRHGHGQWSGDNRRQYLVRTMSEWPTILSSLVRPCGF